MDFRQAESYLLSLGNEVETMKLGLDNIRKLLDALGNPQNEYLKVQVAGTNGKGSVCAFLASICLEAGIKAGVFTSPHLVSITERVRVNGIDITEADFAQHASAVRDTAERMVADGELGYTPTFFEQVTAIALLAFAEAGIELAILETGLGGRLDATTAANAEVAAVTRIGLDHQEYLGDTIEQIASEKAAIIDGPLVLDVVIGKQNPTAFAVLLRRCEAREIEPVTGQDRLDWTIRKASQPGYVKLDTSLMNFNECKLGLKGDHQIENAQVAVSVSQVLHYGYVELPDEAVFLGIQHARHPGRLEFFGRYLFDGAHNIGGANALREFLDEFVTQPITLVFGVMKDKDVAGFAEIVFPSADDVILTDIGNARSMTAQEMSAAISDMHGHRFHFAPNVNEALEKANEIAGGNGLIVVTGSLYLVGEAKRILSGHEFEI